MRPSKSLGNLLHHHSKSAAKLSGLQDAKYYPPDAEQYELLEDVGKGVSATVYLVWCKTAQEHVAIKALNLEALNSPLEDIMQETRIMKAYRNEHLLPLYCSFVNGQQLWMVMPYMEGGSVAHLMRHSQPDGLEEVLIATIMKPVLQALAYMHERSGIHRDVKAGNVLVDAEGRVKLGDFGVSATMERDQNWESKSRMTFVGTPCWMAPEVLEQSSEGYGSAADIWSFGITMLEMAYGHAPFYKYPPMKVLLMVLQEPSPELQEKYHERKFSTAMQDVVRKCLQKNPKDRPTAKQLLEHKFFRQARDALYVKQHLLQGLPPLPERVAEIKAGKAATRARDNDVKAVASQVAYISDVASWDFSSATGTEDVTTSGPPGAAAASAAASASAASDGTVSPFSMVSTPLGSPVNLSRPETPLLPLPSVTEHGQEQQDVATQQQQPGRLEPTGGRPLSAVPAASKRSGRFTVYEGAYEGPEDEAAAAAAAAEQSAREQQHAAHQMLVRQRSLSSPNLGAGRAAARAAAAAAVAHEAEGEVCIPHLDLDEPAAAVVLLPPAGKAAGALGQKDQWRRPEQAGSASPRSPRREVRKQISFDVPEQREAAQQAAAAGASLIGAGSGGDSPSERVPDHSGSRAPGAAAVAAAASSGPGQARDSSGLRDLLNEPSITAMLAQETGKAAEEQQQVEQAGVSPLGSPGKGPPGSLQAAKPAAAEPSLARPSKNAAAVAAEPSLARPGAALAGAVSAEMHHKPSRSGSPLKMWDQLCDSLKDIGKALYVQHANPPGDHHATGPTSHMSGTADGSYITPSDISSRSQRSPLTAERSSTGSTTVLAGRPPRAGSLPGEPSGAAAAAGAPGVILSGFGKPPKSRTSTPVRSHTTLEAMSPAAAAAGAVAASPAAAEQAAPAKSIPDSSAMVPVDLHVRFAAIPVSAGGGGGGGDHMRIEDGRGLPPRALPVSVENGVAAGAAAPGSPELLAVQHSIDAPQSASRDQRDQGAMSPGAKPEVALAAVGESGPTPGAAVDEELYQQQQWEQALAAGTVPAAREAEPAVCSPSLSVVKKKGRFVIRED